MPALQRDAAPTVVLGQTQGAGVCMLVAGCMLTVRDCGTPTLLMQWKGSCAGFCFVPVL
jgi:hypothetical protein